MIRGSSKHFLEALASLALIVLLAIAYFAWRIDRAPVSLGFLVPYVERALNDPASGRSVDIADMTVFWHHEDRAVEFQLQDVRVAGSNGQPIATLPTTEITISLPALLRGKVAPRRVRIVGPEILLERRSDGGIGVALDGMSTDKLAQQTPTDANGTPPDPIAMLDEWGGSALSELRRVEASDATIRLRDVTTDVDWQLEHVRLGAERSGRDLLFDGAFSTDLGDGEIRVRANARLDGATRDLSVQLKTSGIRPKRLAGRVPQFVRAVGAELPIDVDATAVFDPAFKPVSATATFTVGTGRIVDTHMPDGSMEIAGGTVRLTYDGGNDRLSLDPAELRLSDGTMLQVKGLAAGLVKSFDGGPLAIDGEVALRNVDLARLPHLWPEGIGANPRRWLVANMTDGRATETTLKVSVFRPVATPSNSAPDFLLKALDGQIVFEAVKLTYFGKLPPIEQAAGIAKFNQRGFDIAVTGGQVKRLKLSDGKVLIAGLDAPDQTIAIAAKITGPLTDVMQVLDMPPLGYIRRFGMQAQSIEGDSVTQLSIKFPLLDALKIEQVDITASANVTNARIPKVFRDLNMTEGVLKVDLDGKGLDLDGNAKLADIPMKVHWREQFAARAPFRRRFDVSGALDESGRKVLAIDVGSLIAGPVGFAIQYTELDQQRATFTGRLDMAPSTIALDDFGWRKAAGVPATGSFDLAMVNGRFVSLTSGAFDGGGLSFRGSGAFDGESRLQRLDIARVTQGETDIGGRVVIRRDAAGKPGYDIALNGRGIDVSPLMKDSDDQKSSDPSSPMDISVKVDRVVMGPQRAYTSVSGGASFDGVRWQRARVDGQAGDKPFAVTLTPQGNVRILSVTAEDAGALLKTADLSTNVLGGRLKLTAQLDNSVERITGHVDIDSYRLVKAPALAELLAVASITGIPEMLTGEGIAFNSLNGDFVRTATATEIIQARTAGLALGLTVKGKISRPEGIADLSGTIVPIAGLNRAISAIPLIGDLLTGQGGGLLAFTFTAKGPIDKPSVSVNPLSILAPSFLQNLFEKLDSSSPPSAGSRPVVPPAPGLSQ